VSISTHVLDTARGRPATGVAVTLSRRDAKGAWSDVANAVTDADGRVKEFSLGRIEPGDYRLDFDTAAYFDGAAFYPEVSIVFTVTDAGAHHHVPLLLAPFGYSTYRGT
jgi:5-hydroxyisourate hydrolase